MKNGLGRNVNGPTRPSVTLPKSARGLHMLFKLYSSDLEREMRRKMKNGLGWNGPLPDEDD